MADIRKTTVKPARKNTSGVVEEGDVVNVHYRGTFDDGEVFDSSEGKDPLEFVVGAHQVVPGFEDAVLGMKKNEKKTVRIEPKDAYGEPREELQQTVPRQAMGDLTPEEGMMLSIQHPQMPQPMPAKVVSVTNDEVVLDLNHPLAGKTLNFNIELVSIK